MAIELLLNFIMSFGSTEAMNIFASAGKSWIKNHTNGKK